MSDSPSSLFSFSQNRLGLLGNTITSLYRRHTRTRPNMLPFLSFLASPFLSAAGLFNQAVLNIFGFTSAGVHAGMFPLIWLFPVPRIFSMLINSPKVSCRVDPESDRKCQCWELFCFLPERRNGRLWCCYTEQYRRFGICLCGWCGSVLEILCLIDQSIVSSLFGIQGQADTMTIANSMRHLC